MPGWVTDVMSSLGVFSVVTLMVLQHLPTLGAQRRMLGHEPAERITSGVPGATRADLGAELLRTPYTRSSQNTPSTRLGE
ncbi:MAG: hypothetical protein H0V21_02795 [Rubrobacter sp.]|nr:hypothetical protein [Rubrobacter sp.]